MDGGWWWPGLTSPHLLTIPPALSPSHLSQQLACLREIPSLLLKNSNLTEKESLALPPALPALPFYTIIIIMHCCLAALYFDTFYHTFVYEET